MVKIAIALPIALALASYAPSAVAAPVRNSDDVLTARDWEYDVRQLGETLYDALEARGATFDSELDTRAHLHEALYELFERQALESPELVERNGAKNFFKGLWGGIKGVLGFRRSLELGDLEYREMAAYDELD